MAIHAVLAYRRMLPEERTPLVLVAVVALIVDGVGADQFLGLGSVRIVAGGALQLKRAAFVPKQVPRALERRFAYVCVTSKTGLGLRLVSQQFALLGWSVDGMAAQAADSGRLMRAGPPEHHMFISRMTTQAGSRNDLRSLLALIGDELWLARDHVPGWITAMASPTIELPATKSEL